jgi:hypothetical protein
MINLILACMKVTKEDLFKKFEKERGKEFCSRFESLGYGVL